MILSSFCLIFYDKIQKSGDVKMNIIIPTCEKEFVADIDTAELFIAENSDGTDMVFIVSRTRTSKHEYATRKYQEELERADGNTKRTNSVLALIIAESLLVSWKNVFDDKGKAVEPTTENKVAVLVKYPALINKISMFSANVKNFKSADDDEALESGILDDESKKDDARGNSESV